MCTVYIIVINRKTNRYNLECVLDSVFSFKPSPSEPSRCVSLPAYSQEVPCVVAHESLKLSVDLTSNLTESQPCPQDPVRYNVC